MNETPVPAGRGSKRFLAIGALCVGLVLAGVAARYFLLTAASAPYDTSPAPRQGLNAPFVTTPDFVVDEMVKLANISSDDVVYDLGCGDGRMVVTAAMKSGCRGVGYDIDPDRVVEAEQNAELHGVADRVEIVQQDVFTVDLTEADVCLMYLLPWMMNKLIPQFDAMPPGCRIVAHEFWIDGVLPDQIVDVSRPGREGDRVYLYTTPLKHDPTMEKGKPPQIANTTKAEPPSDAAGTSPTE